MNIKKYTKRNKISKTTNGFAMLFAVLTASLLLTIGMSIFNISFKELIISTNSKGSQIAFFAADSARECAYYWDSKVGVFQACGDQACSPEAMLEPLADMNLAKCNYDPSNPPTKVAQFKLLPRSGSSTSTYVYTYESDNKTAPLIKFGDSSLSPEADILIVKSYNLASTSIVTKISGFGHNTAVTGRRLERAIEQTSTW